MCKKVSLLILSILIMVNCFILPYNVNAAFLELDNNSFINLYYTDGNGYFEADTKSVKADANAFLEEFEAAVTVKSSGDLYRFNNAKANEKIEVSDYTAQLFLLCIKYKKETLGAFSPLTFNATRIWGFSPDYEGQYSKPRPNPNFDDISKALKTLETDLLTDGDSVSESKQYVRLSNDNGQYFLEKSDNLIMLDFGGIAKGYATDIIKDKYLSQINRGAIKLLSSSVILGNYVFSENSIFAERPFNVYVENPRAALYGSGNAFLIKGVSNGFITTSSDSYRAYIYKNKIYSHIIDTKTALPADNGVISVTILADSGAEAEAYSTAVFGLGLKSSIQLLTQKGIRSVIVTNDYKYYVTGGIEVENISDKLFTAGNISSVPDIIQMSEKEKVYLGIKKQGVFKNTIVAITASLLCVIAIVFLTVRKGKNTDESEK